MYFHDRCLIRRHRFTLKSEGLHVTGIALLLSVKRLRWIFLAAVPLAVFWAQASSSPAGDACLTVAESRRLLAERSYEEIWPSGTQSVREDVFGITLEGTPDQLARTRQILSETPPLSWPAVAQGCSDVACALSRVVNPLATHSETGKRLLVIAERDGFIVSLSRELEPVPARQPVPCNPATRIAQVWSDTEIAELHVLLTRLPDRFRRQPGIKKIFREKKQDVVCTTMGYRYGNHVIDGREWDGAFIFLEPMINGASSVFTHELAHGIDTAQSSHDYFAGQGYVPLPAGQRRASWSVSDEWRSLKFEKTQQGTQTTWVRKPQARWVSDYAMRTPAEGFAEAIAFYVLMPDQALLWDRDEYQFLRNRIFGQKDYLSTWAPPALLEALERMGGPAEILRDCFAGLQAVIPWADPTRAMNMLDFKTIHPDNGLILPAVADHGGLHKRCSDRIWTRVRAELTDEAVCQTPGGQQNLSAWTFKLTTGYIRAAMGLMETSGFRSPSETVRTACVGELSDRARIQCRIRKGFKDEYTSDPVLSRLDPGSAAALGEFLSSRLAD